MKKQISTIFALMLCLVAFAQSNTTKLNEGKWELSAALGAINFDNTATLNVQDNINVGLTFGATRRFSNNFFTSAGVTFSTLKNVEGVWENPLNYFSVNAGAGFRFKSALVARPFVVPYIAVGGSFINAANTLPNAENSYSFNGTVGFIFWLNQSNFGLTIEDTYKFVDSNYMVNHNQIKIGVRYKL